MREIKFRYRLSSDSFPWKTTTISLEDFASGAVHLYSMDPDAEFAGQYTGIKDINGVEIYEGDIVTRYFKPNTLQMNIVIYWDEDNHAWNGKLNNYVDVNVLEWKDIEVIGNIYENPELLNG